MKKTTTITVTRTMSAKQFEKRILKALRLYHRDLIAENIREGIKRSKNKN